MDLLEDVPDVKLQKSFVAKQLQKPLTEGELWYIIDISWFKQWKSYVGCESWDQRNVGEDSTHPGPIDNTRVFIEGTNKLKESLKEGLDYILVPEEGWNKLFEWYGLVDGQNHSGRKVIREGVQDNSSLKVEVYTWFMKLCENSDLENVVIKEFSKNDTIGKLEEVARKVFNIPSDKEVRLWNRHLTNMYEQLKKKHNTLQDAGLYQGQVIVIEQKNMDEKWPRDK